MLTAVVVATSAVTMAMGHRLIDGDLRHPRLDGGAGPRHPGAWSTGGRGCGCSPAWWPGSGSTTSTRSCSCSSGSSSRALSTGSCGPSLRTPWPWLAGLIAALLWVPNLLWQADHGWPVFDLSADIADEYGGLVGRIELVGQAAIMFSPLIFVVWVAGLVQLLRSPSGAGPAARRWCSWW